MYRTHNTLFTLLALSTCVALASPAFAQIRYALDDASGSGFAITSTEDRVFSDGWDDGDADVVFGFNYATGGVGDPGSIIGAPFPAGLPEAPNSLPGDTPRTGLFISADDNIFINSAGISQVAVLPTDPSNSSQLLSITGNYEVQVDVWMNYRTSSGNATEYGGLLVGHDGDRPGILAGGGFAYAGDSGAVSDHRLYKAAAASEGIADLTGNDQDGAYGAQNQFINSNGTGADGQYNPDIGLTYFNDPQFDSQSRAALDNENDFWQDAFTDRFDLGAALTPYDSQSAAQGGTSPVNNAPGDLGFRWATIRIEVEPGTMGTGSRSEVGIARVYLTATWQDDGDNDLGTFDPVTHTSPELFIGTLDNSIDTIDLLGFVPEPIDFTKGIAMTYFDGFPSFDDSGLVFGIFDNLIITPEASGLVGDYNGNGTVDAADYTVWRDTEGDTVTPGTGADGDGDGTIGAGDYTEWVNNFGSSSLATSVPEPGSLLMVLAAMAGISCRVSRRFSC